MFALSSVEFGIPYDFAMTSASVLATRLLRRRELVSYFGGVGGDDRSRVGELLASRHFGRDRVTVTRPETFPGALSIGIGANVMRRYQI